MWHDDDNTENPTIKRPNENDEDDEDAEAQALREAIAEGAFHSLKNLDKNTLSESHTPNDENEPDKTTKSETPAVNTQLLPSTLHHL